MPMPTVTDDHRRRAKRMFGFDANDLAQMLANYDNLLTVIRDHDFPMGPDSARPNPYGTFSDALRNLAAELPATDRMHDWAEWLRTKASAMEAAIG